MSLSLHYDFVNDKSLNDKVGANHLTSIRALDTATYRDSGGVRQVALANTPRFDHTAAGVSLGLLNEPSRTQYLGDTGNPATQTTASLATGSYTLWVEGAGSALASGGTATISGAASATEGSENIFSVDVAGTVTITVTSSLDIFQLENGSFASSYIPNAGAAGTTVLRNNDRYITTDASFYNQGAGNTAYIEAALYAESGGRLWGISSGGSYNRSQLIVTGQNASNFDLGLQITTNGSLVANIVASGANISYSTYKRIAVRMDSDNFRLAWQGASGLNDTAGEPSTGIAQLVIGAHEYTTGYCPPMHVKGFRWYNGGLDNDTITAMVEDGTFPAISSGGAGRTGPGLSFGGMGKLGV